MVALYSCSMHAAITTDSSGRVVEVSALRFESSLRRVALAMLVAGGQIAFEFRWQRAWADHGSSVVDAGAGSPARLPNRRSEL